MNAISSPDVIDDFIQFSSHLPNVKHRAYELKVTKYASNKISKLEFDILLTWLKNQIDLSDQSVNKDSHFVAFIVLCIYSRRMKNLTTYYELIRNFGPYFEDELLYPHIVALYHKQFDTPEEIELAMHYANKAVRLMPNHVGVLHSYVDSVVTAEEHNLKVPKAILEDAKLKMDEIVKLDNKYAKFHCTRGRLLAIFKQYPEAKRAIHKAIDQEDSTSTDYSIRINEYQSHLIRIQTAETSSIILSQLEATTAGFETSKKELEASMEKLQKDNLQFLGFFVAIISLTIGSLNMIDDKTFQETAFLIMILTGCILLGYVSLGVLFQPKQIKRIYQFYVFFIGILLIGVPFLINYLK